jgi:4-amino-4-deoxy-L-arabinose transferase-like glycosyltransferase
MPRPRLRSRRTLRLALQILAPLLVLLVIAFLGVRQAKEKLAIVKPVEFIGHADEASYALQGKGIAAGHGIRVPYISTFFLQYPDTIIHREDHWPPFMGYSIAPFFYFLGADTWVARIPGILYGSLALPVAAGLLAYALTRRHHVALLAALLMMASPEIYQHSMRALSDVATAMLVTAFCAAVMLARRHPTLYVAAGIAAACAYFSKGSEILLLAFYPILALLSAGPRIFKSRWFYAGPIAAVLLMAPHWFANWRDYGNPLHSTQNYVAAFFGFENWDEQFYAPYWGKNLPHISDRWTKHDDYRTLSRRQLVMGAGALLSGALEDRRFAPDQRQIWSDFGDRGTAFREWLLGDEALRAERGHRPPPRRKPAPRDIKPLAEWKSPVTEFATFTAIPLLLLALAAIPLQLLRMFRGLRRPLTLFTRRHLWMLNPALGIALIIAFHIVFIAYFWKFEPRFMFPIVPLIIALGCAAAWHFCTWPLKALAVATIFTARKLRRPFTWQRRRQIAILRQTFPAAVTILLAAAALFSTDRIYQSQRQLLSKGGVTDSFPFYSGKDPHIAMGKWLAQNLPDAVVMCRSPWELLFYAGPNNKGVGLPNPSDYGQRGAEEIFAIARYYHVSHMYIDTTRPSLAPYLYRGKPGLKKIPNAPAPLYELDWSKLPTKTVNDLWP